MVYLGAEQLRRIEVFQFPAQKRTEQLSVENITELGQELRREESKGQEHRDQEFDTGTHTPPNTKGRICDLSRQITSQLATLRESMRRIQVDIIMFCIITAIH